MVKILKNTTGSVILINDTGVSLPATPTSYTIPSQDYNLWMASNDIVAKINSGNVVVNNGTSDLSAAKGLIYIQEANAKYIGEIEVDLSGIGDQKKIIYDAASNKYKFNADSPGSAAGAKGEIQVRGNSPGSFTAFTNFKWNDVKQSLQVGPNDNGLNDNPLDIGGNTNGWVQNNIKNSNAGAAASSDVICTKDTGTDSAGFIDVGINSSGYSTAAYNSGGPGDGYVMVNGGSLAIITETNHDIAFFTNGATTNEERLKISKEGNVVVGRAALATTATNGFLYVPGSAGVPTGVPTTYAGRLAITVDTTNGKVYYYSGGWKILANTKADLSLGNVDNTSDADKPVSTAQQTALDLKSPLASPTFTGTPAAPTPANADNSTKIATTAFVKAQVYGKSIINTTLSDNTNPYSSTVATTYAVLGKFIYLGSTDIGALTKIYAIISQDSGGQTSIRIYDVTNALTIAELTGFNDTTATIKDLGAISNLPTGQAIFEIQLKTSNASKVVRISNVLAKV